MDMSTLELKLSLIEQLTQIDDEQLLHKIKNLISQHTGKKAERLPAGMECHKVFYQPERVGASLGTFYTRK